MCVNSLSYQPVTATVYGWTTDKALLVFLSHLPRDFRFYPRLVRKSSLSDRNRSKQRRRSRYSEMTDRQKVDKYENERACGNSEVRQLWKHHRYLVGADDRDIGLLTENARVGRFSVMPE